MQINYHLNINLIFSKHNSVFHSVNLFVCFLLSKQTHNNHLSHSVLYPCSVCCNHGGSPSLSTSLLCVLRLIVSLCCSVTITANQKMVMIINGLILSNPVAVRIVGYLGSGEPGKLLHL